MPASCLVSHDVPRFVTETFDIARAADQVGLTLGGVDDLVWTRETRRRGDDISMVYRDADGMRITDSAETARLDALAVPPAYGDVRLSPDPRSHLQAIGRDEAGRVQYRYHADWDRVREHEKALRLARLIRALPRIRARVAKDLEMRGPTRQKALAATVRLIDRAHVRIGNDGYLKSNRTHGATTLLKRHITARGRALALKFTGKSGKRIAKRVEGAGLARALKSLTKLPGRRAFQYRDEEGRVRPVTAGEVNAYLAGIAGEAVTAKDFRTLAASAKAAERLAGEIPAASPTARARQIAGVMRDVSETLANTPAVTRKSYVHDAVVEGFENGTLSDAYAGSRGGHRLTRAERTVAKLVATADEEE